MTSTFSPNKNYELQATGDNPNTWGSELNTKVFTIIDENLGGRLAIDCAGAADITPTQDQSANLYHKMTGLLTGDISYILPNAGGMFLLKNSTTGAHTITAKPTGGTGIVVPQGATVPVFVNPDTASLGALFDTLPSINVSGSTAPAAGLYLPTANNLGLSANSALQLNIQGTALAVNYLQVAGGASGSPGIITLSAQGSDANIQMNVRAKGTAGINLYTNDGAQQQLAVTHTVNAVNFYTITGAATGAGPNLIVSGSDTNIDGNMYSKGTGALNFYTNFGGSQARQFRITHTATAVNYLAVTGGATGSGPSLTATGADANIPITLVAKGTSRIAFNIQGVTQFAVNSNTSAANYFSFAGSATGGGPNMVPNGTDTNIDANYYTLGTGQFNFYTNFGAGQSLQMKITDTPSAVTYLNVTGGATGINAILSIGSADANAGLSYFTKGSGSHNFGTALGATQLSVTHTASAVNYLGATGGAAGNGVTLSSAGADANIPLIFSPKGTGDLRCANVNSNTTGSAANVNVDTSGNIRKATSSLRYKTDIRDLDIDPALLARIRPVLYKSKIESDGTRDFAGFIAEDFHGLGLTPFVTYQDDAPDGIQYGQVAALLMKFAQMHDVRIAALEAR